MRRLLGLAILASLLLSSCTNSREPASDVITVEGSVTVRGNEPFAAYVLETAEHNYYVLRFPELDPPATPEVLTVTGRLYEAEWDGRPFAHIDVHSIGAPPAQLTR